MSIFGIQQKMKLRIAVFLLLAVLVPLIPPRSLVPFAVPRAEAAINPEINYQGKLLDATGVPVADGTYSIVFRLYTVPTGGSNIWTETQSVPVQNGLFSVMLGTSTSLASVNFNQTLYLGINVEADGEMAPRKVLGAVPAAFEANNANTVGGVASTSFVRSDAADTIAASTAATLLTIQQNGAGDILNLFDGATEVFTVTDGGRVGIGTTTPTRELVVDGDFQLTGGIFDNNGTRGTAGYVLQTTGAGIEWVATSSLGFAAAGSAHDPVTLAGTPNYITLSGQQLTLTQLDLADDLATFTSSALIGRLTDETGTGRAVFSASPAFSGTATFSALSATGTATFAGVSLTSATTSQLAISSLTSGRIPYVTTGGRLIDSSALTFDGNNLGVGVSQGIAFGGTRYLYASSTNDSISFGEGAGALFNSGTVYNVALGYQAGGNTSSATGDFNIYAGYRAGYNNTGSSSILLGYRAGESNSGSYNVAIGESAGRNMNNTYNVFVGYGSGLGMRGSNNTALGTETMNGAGSTVSVSNNVAIGYRAGYNFGNSSSNNILIGYQAGDNITVGAVGNIVIGYDIDNPGGATTDDRLTIGNLIFGTGIDGTGTTVSSGNVGIGTSTPSSRFQVYVSNTTTASPVASLKQNSTGDVGLGFVLANANNFVLGIDNSDSDKFKLSYGASGNAALGTNDYLTVTTAGNVGIGTTTPNQKLSIFANAADAAIEFSTVSGAAEKWTIGIDDSDGAKFKISSSSALGTNDRFVINGAGNIGIGDSSPASLFTVGSGDLFQINSSGVIASSNNITPNSILSSGQTDEYCLTYESTGTTFEWQTCGSGGSGLATTSIDTSAELAAILGDETGTAGSVVFSISPTFTGTATFAGASLTSATTTQLAISSLTAGRIPYVTTGGRLIDSASFAYNGNDLNLGTTKGIAWGGDRIIKASSTKSAYFFGNLAGEYITTGSNNIGIGSLALQEATSSSNNIAIGSEAGRRVSSGGANVFIGPAFAGTYNTSGSLNVFIGYAAGPNNDTGSANTLLGNNAGYALQSGDGNSMLGTYVGNNLATSSQSTIIGAGAAWGFAGAYQASNLTILGREAGFNLQTGADNNILIGYNAANALTTGANNIVLGYNIDLQDNTWSNRLNIGNLIFGTGIDGEDTTLSSGNIGIGTTSPMSKFTVAGDARITGSLRDSSGDAGTNGMVLLSTGSGINWVATSSLGIAGGTLANDSVTPDNVRSSSQTDEYCLTYEASGDTWEWQTCSTGGGLAATDIDTSAELAAILTDETGTAGSVVFSISPTFTGTATFANAALTSATTTQLAISSLTSGRVPYVSTGGRLIDSANFTFDGSNLGFGATQGIAWGGIRALYASTTLNNYFFGENIGGSISGGNNVALGLNALLNAADASGNIAIGTNAGQALSSGDDNIFIGGSFAGYSNTSGTDNIFIGYAAGGNNTTGWGNVMIGNSAGNALRSGDNNSVYGRLAAQGLATSSNSTIIGHGAAYGNGGEYDADNLTILGREAGFNLQTGADNNILIGYNAANALTTGANNIVLGYNIDLQDNTWSNRLNIGNLIFGTGIDGEDTTLSSGNIGIGTTTPNQKFTVAGNINLGTPTAALFMNSQRVLYASSTNSSIAVGQLTGAALLTTAVRNTALGYRTLRYATSSDDNTAIGWAALEDNASGYDNTAVGSGALTVNSSGYRNTGIGSSALYNNTTGFSNTAVGMVSMFSNNSGYTNVAVGDGSMYANTSGFRNVAVGYNSLDANTTGFQNTAVGYVALGANATGTWNTAVGAFALQKSTYGTRNTAVGDSALSENLTGYGNTAIGMISLFSNTTGFRNTAVGDGSLYSVTSGSGNTAVGYNALDSIVSGANNTAVGNGALSAATSTLYNTATGYRSMFSTTWGDTNAAYGYQSLYTNTTGSSNTAMGYNAMFANTTGGFNTAVGSLALDSNATGTSNAAFGYNALNANRGGGSNVALGALSLFSNISGINNTAVGVQAGYDVTSAASSGNNTFLGYNTGRGITTGLNNTIIGANVTGLSATLANNIIIADGAGNRRINVDSNGNVGIGTTTPSQILSLYKLGADAAISFGTNTGTAEKWTIGIDDSDGAKFKISSSSALGTNDRFVIDGRGYIGIGTASPTQTLTVAGTMNVTGTATFAGASLTSATSTQVAVSSLTSGRVPYVTTGGRLIDSANFTFDGTNLGFGNTQGISWGGIPALYASTTRSNYFFGEQAGGSITSGANNIGIGYLALTAAGSGSGNIAIGTQAARKLNTGSDNVFIGGAFTGYENTSGTDNIFIGYATGFNNRTGDGNIMIGNSAGNALRSGGDNSVYGRFAAQSLATSSYSTILGHGAAWGISGDYQANNLTIIGREAGYSLQTGANNNILIGFNAANALTTGANNIVLGYDIDLANNTWSNRLNIGNLIFGTGIDGTGTTLSSGNIGIGTTTPNNKLSIHNLANDAAIGFGTNTGSAEKWTIGIDDSDRAKFKISSSSALGTNDRFVIDGAGRIGIGTSTPTHQLSLLGSQASDYVARISNTNTANTADGLLIALGVANASRGTGNYFIGFAQVSGNTVAGKIQGGASAVAYTTTAADLAEFFPVDSDEAMPEKGEIVMLDPEREKNVKRAEPGAVPFGIITTNPGFIGNGPICKVNDNTCDDRYAEDNALVSLIGQVPLKVNSDNGPIAIGDSITISSTEAGVGMRANFGDRAVAYALEPLDEGVDAATIRVYVTNHTALGMNPDPTLLGAETAPESLPGEEIFNRMVKLVEGFVDGILNIAGLRTSEICVYDDTGETCIDRSTLNSLLQGSASNGSNTPDNLAPEPAPEPESEPTPDSTPTPEPVPEVAGEGGEAPLEPAEVPIDSEPTPSPSETGSGEVPAA